MTTNKIVIFTAVIAIIIIITVPTFYKVVKENHRRLYVVNNKLVTEAAERCYYEGKCSDKKITLKELYQNKYLTDEIIDPVTKAVYNDASYILINEKDSTFFPKE